jgi:alpha-glucosidase
MGYDISNYRDIDKWYGTLDDWEAVKNAVHERGMKLVMDLVVNHTSDQVCATVEAQLTSARLVQRVSLVARQPKERLVHLAASQDQ